MSEGLRLIVVIGVYLAGWIGLARALYVWESREPGGSDGFAPTILGLIWPVLLGLAVVLLPIVAVGWLISRPVRRGHGRP